MSKSAKWILVIVGILAASFVIFKMKSKGSKTEKVTTEKAAKRTIIESVSTSGKIYPETEVKVSPDFSGQVTELKIAEGESVKKGQLLARINNRTSIEAPIDGVVLSLKIKKGESVTGNNFSVGTEMMTIADMSALEVRSDVGENDIVKINIGDSADVVVDAYNNRKFKGVVTKIANSTKTSMASLTSNDVTNYEVRIRLDKESYKDLADKVFPFRPGMNVSAEIRTKKEENILSVPIAAVNARVKDSDKSMEDKRREDKVIKDQDAIPTATALDDKLEEVVFIIQKDGTVKKTVVKSGIQDINYIGVMSGLKEGDEVVVGPYIALSKNLKDGMKVKVVPKEKLFEK
ncbi:MAG: efflux RND transporter periplasmic adaptor subunit [Ferruginibacter sp.]|nr:efflux RND transporter periplasmic adaptor subunit [Chitinophagaceae bacterium]